MPERRRGSERLAQQFWFRVGQLHDQLAEKRVRPGKPRPREL